MTRNLLKRGEPCPQHLLLVREEQMAPESMTEAEFQNLLRHFFEWTEGPKAKGVFLGMEKLKDERGKTARKPDGALVIDGPYSEAKEAVVGAFHVAAQSYEDALELAGQVPPAQLGASV